MWNSHQNVTSPVSWKSVSPFLGAYGESNNTQHVMMRL